MVDKKLRPEELEELGICPDCQGRGKWVQTIIQTEDEVDYETTKIKLCESCNGTGQVKVDGDVD